MTEEPTEKISKLRFDTDESETNQLLFTIDKVNEIIQTVNVHHKTMEMVSKAMAKMTDLLEVHDTLLKTMFPDLVAQFPKLVLIENKERTDNPNKE